MDSVTDRVLQIALEKLTESMSGYKLRESPEACILTTRKLTKLFRWQHAIMIINLLGWTSVHMGETTTQASFHNRSLVKLWSKVH